MAIQAPFSDATTPGGTASLMMSGRTTLPSSFQTRMRFTFSRPRAAASMGLMNNGGASPGLPPSPNKVEEIRLSDAGEISDSGSLVARGL